METRYVVIAEDGNVSYSAKKEEPESFIKFRGKGGAEERAKELSRYAPGAVIRIYELTAEVVTPLAEIAVSRKHPTGHYG